MVSGQLDSTKAMLTVNGGEPSAVLVKEQW